MSVNDELLKINSTRFGEFEVRASAQIEFPSGLIGFPHASKFVLIEYTEPFSWLHCTHNPELAFVVVNAAEFGENYNFDLPVGDRDLDLQENDEVAVLNMVTVRPSLSDTTVNLKAPLVVNLRNRRGRQFIIDDARFSMRFPLWAAKEAAQEPQK